MAEVMNRSEALVAIKHGLASRKERVAQMLPDGSMKPERFLQLAVQLCERQPELLQCTPISVIGSIMEACSVGLSLDPILGQAHILKYGQRASLLVGYRGIQALALKGGGVRSITSAVVRRQDEFRELLGTDQRIFHERPPIAEQGEAYAADASIVGAYAVAELADGGRVFRVLNLSKILEAKACAKTKNVWNAHFEAQCMKTTIRRLEPFLPLNAEPRRILAREDLMDAGQPSPPTEEELREVDIDSVESTTQVDEMEQELNELGGVGQDESGDIPPLKDIEE